MGKWLYGEGMKKYGMIPEMRDLEKVHAQLHTIVKRVVQIKNYGNIHAAKLKLEKLELVGNRVVDLIISVEEKINALKGQNIL